METLSFQQLADFAGRANLADEFGPIVELGPAAEFDAADAAWATAQLDAEPILVVGLDTGPLSAQDRSTVIDLVNTAPDVVIATTLLIRSSVTLAKLGASRQQRLLNESLTYSALQGGTRFKCWLDERVKDRAVDALPAVLGWRHGSSLEITLNRPQIGNAVSPAMRDELCEFLGLALSDPTIQIIDLRGNGKNFCTGGDLNTFGTFLDTAGSHTARLSRSPARLLSALRESTKLVQAHVHGRCSGSGLEFAAFAMHFAADASTLFSLPEARLGLVPGAGGTVSIVDRIGGPKTLELLLTGATIDAATALRWGLIDSIEPHHPGD